MKAVTQLVSGQPQETKQRKIKFLPLLALLFASILSGCGTVVGTTINVANKIDQDQYRSRLSDLVAAHLQWVKALQAKGDPMGDYLWAKANEDGMVDNPIQDTKIIKQMYVDAATKGSVDAQIVLALKRFREGAGQRRDDIGKDAEWLPKVPIWQDGLMRIEQATQRRCYYLKPYIFAPHNRRCLAPRIVADDVWPDFRDGHTYPKDPSLRDHWYDKAIACEASPGFQQALRDCPVFGYSNYRFKGK